jgi:hypothetical protein
LGLGNLSKEKPWGILAIADFSGFIIDEHNYTFATAELNSVYRILTGDHGESRIQMGLTYKEIPEVIINGVTEKTEGVGTYVSWGPHLGYEYWLAMTPKLGLQLNAHLYYNNMKITTPNGQELLPSLSTQLGILGSYKINARTTGLMGYAYRLDKASSTSKRDPAKTNTVELQGNYVNLFLEWAL